MRLQGKTGVGFFWYLGTGARARVVHRLGGTPVVRMSHRHKTYHRGLPTSREQVQGGGLKAISLHLSRLQSVHPSPLGQRLCAPSAWAQTHRLPASCGCWDLAEGLAFLGTTMCAPGHHAPQ